MLSGIFACRGASCVHPPPGRLLLQRQQPTSDYLVEDTLRVLPCGGDPSSLSPGSIACDELTNCPDLTQHCPCTTMEDLEGRGAFAAEHSSVTCHSTTCPEGQTAVPTGPFCTCVGDQSNDPGPPPPLPYVDHVIPMSGGIMSTFLRTHQPSGTATLVRSMTTP